MRVRQERDSNSLLILTSTFRNPFLHIVIKASEPVVSVILGLIVNGIVPKPLTAASLLPITYGVAYASTLGQLDAKTMSKELTTKAAK